ncbi:transcription antitermination factor NusB [Thioalkalivibrio sp.]|uniref:transcription antitermination factor NusB n=1 Tax=Thioalkalivibrio sp. TaxID=2093813 RepID=UPI003566A86A
MAALSRQEQHRQIHARQAARRRAMQALYSWQLTGDHPKNILASFREDEEHANADAEYFREILMGVTSKAAALDETLAPVVGRPLQQLDPIEHALLWVGTWELSERLEVPYRVVINEAVGMAKKYGAEQSHRFINGVLDTLARQLRSAERAAPRRTSG